VKPSSKAILFFDGDCGLCNRSVRFLIRKDKQQRLYFAPLQGIAAQAILPAELRESLTTIVYQRVASDGQTSLLVRSDAALLALIDTGSSWRFLARIALVLPLRFRDWAYDQIAERRGKLKKAAACKMPTKEAQRRILP
jgi:predicted DCC family thiol-disulfide oxidoreductase YuxK